MAAGRQRRAEAETFDGPVEAGVLHRARIGVRRSAVDYFRGDGSDWIALAGLLLTVPADRPDDARQLRCGAPRPPSSCRSSPAACCCARRACCGLYAAAATALIVESVALGPYTEGPARVTPGTVLRGRRLRLLRPAHRPVPQPGRRAVAARRHHALRPARTHPGAEQAAAAAARAGTAEMALRPAGGQSFSGDFVVAARTNGGRTLEVVLTDVSGKGMDAGSRALLLSGAFGGLLGSLPPHAFLPAANGYLLRQDWDEGFATSIHLVLDLDSGDYELLLRGPPAGPATPRGQRPLGGEGRRGPAARRLRRGRSSTRVKGSLRARRRADAVHRRPGGDRRPGHRPRASTGSSARPTATSPAASSGAAWHLIEAVAKDVNDDRALLVVCRD